MANPRPPGIERVLAAVRPRLEDDHAHDALVAAARAVVAGERARLAGDADVGPRPVDALADEVIGRLGDAAGWRPQRVINATGVIVHTNLGRAAWPQAAIDAATEAAGGQLFLELDPETGRRGHRFRLAEEHLIALTGAEDAFVANNNAAAVALAVGLAGRGGGVAVSRGELVEIGGGVRIPEIVRRAGARLVEVGTTNRTRVADFAEALAGGKVRIVLRVHPSNFRQAGFVEAPEPAGLAALAHEHGAIVVDDLGSGALIDTSAFGLAHEPTPSERLAAGADVVTFSGDKLVGGPQAGLVVGRADLIDRIRRDPLARAMRPDKVTLAAVAATLGLYRAGLATVEIPVWRAIAASADDVRRRAETTAARIGAGAGVTVEAVESAVGGGSLPGETLPSWALVVEAASVERLLSELRRATPPVVGRIAGNRVVLDLRTVDPADDARLADAVRLSPSARPGRR